MELLGVYLSYIRHFDKHREIRYYTERFSSVLFSSI